MLALTGHEIPEDRKWLSAQGLSLRDLRRRMTWYRPDDKALHRLPTDDYHRTLYRQKGWTLVPPITTALVREVLSQEAVGTKGHGLEGGANTLPSPTHSDTLKKNLSSFLADCCIRQSGASVANPDLWEAYLSWCKSKAEPHALGRKTFTQGLTALDGVVRSHDGRQRVWKGVRLRGADELPQHLIVDQVRQPPTLAIQDV